VPILDSNRRNITDPANNEPSNAWKNKLPAPGSIYAKCNDIFVSPLFVFNNTDMYFKVLQMYSNNTLKLMSSFLFNKLCEFKNC
jgi:hypothetical protein